MTIRRLVTGSVLALAVLTSAVAWAPQSFAQAGQDLWVGANPVAAGGTSCARPGFSSIQSAINAASPGQQILVCAGTYTEQLQITKPVRITALGRVTVQLPAVPANATTSCDTAMAAGNPPGEQDQDGISICGDIAVTLTGLTVSAAWAAGTCDDSLYGIVVAGDGTLNFDGSSITAAGAVPLNGCQGGVGIQAGDSVASPPQAGHLVLRDSTVEGYQKNGIVIDGTGSSADISSATVTGIGATTQIAQNGIQVSDGASARIDHSSITGDECSYPVVCGPDGLTQTQSAGVLVYQTDAPVTVTSSELSGNDIGVYYLADTSAKAPARPTAVISGDRFDGNRYEAIQLDQGSALVQDCTLSDGNVGVQAIQYASQTFGIDSVVTGVTIRDMNVATVQVLSDQATGDQPGVLLVTGSRIRSGPVLNNSSNIRLVEIGDH
jgi:parallel beta helix pectate lyase-like protein